MPKVIIWRNDINEHVAWCSENIGKRDVLWETWWNTIYDMASGRLVPVTFFGFRDGEGAAAFKLRWT